MLPRYANTHTESSGTGLQTTRLREDARAIVHAAVGGDDETVVIFAGSGCTGLLSAATVTGTMPRTAENLRTQLGLDERQIQQLMVTTPQMLIGEL